MEFQEVVHTHAVCICMGMVTFVNRLRMRWGRGLLPLSAGAAGHGKCVLKGNVNICAKLGANTRFWSFFHVMKEVPCFPPTLLQITCSLKVNLVKAFRKHSL